AADVDLMANVEEQGDATDAVRLAPVAKQVYGQPPVRLQEVAHAPQEGFAEDAPGHARPAKQVDRHVIEALVAGLDKLEGVTQDDVEPARGQPTRFTSESQDGAIVIDPDHAQLTPASAQQAGQGSAAEPENE